MSDTLIASRHGALRRRTALWTTIAGLAVLAAVLAVAWSWRDELPDPVASHWGVAGTADGFSSVTGLLAVMLGFGVVLVLGFGAITLLLGQSAVTRRLGAAMTIWAALFLGLLTLGTLYVQRGLSDARQVGDIGAALLVAVIGSLLPALAVGLLVPGDPHQPTAQPVPADAPRVPLVAGEAASWHGRVGSPAVAVAGISVVGLVLALAVLLKSWPVAIIAVVAGVLIVAMSSFTVRVDGGGLSVRSVLGWPHLRVPIDEVVRADVTQVRPLREFGGWGLRVGRGGRVGVVLRGGEALLVQRTGARSLVVTVDGAASAAGLLNALVDRSRLS